MAQQPAEAVGAPAARASAPDRAADDGRLSHLQCAIYGSVRSTEFRSQEKVGGDLVDALTLANGDTVGYVADIAGHGLAAGLLMGMLKTATRTALRDRSGGEGTELVSDR